MCGRQTELLVLARTGSEAVLTQRLLLAAVALNPALRRSGSETTVLAALLKGVVASALRARSPNAAVLRAIVLLVTPSPVRSRLSLSERRTSTLSALTGTFAGCSDSAVQRAGRSAHRTGAALSPSLRAASGAGLPSAEQRLCDLR